MTSVEVAEQLADYLETLVAELGRHAPLEAVYLLGSAALGAYEHGRSDVDVVAVTERSLSLDERRTLAAAAEAIPCPARKLELVVYPRGSTAWEINLNTGEHVSFDAAEEPPFWFVLDRAIAEQHALPLLGPRWSELFAPEPPEAIEAALDEALAFGGWDEPADADVAAARARIWRETGRWVSKREAKEGVAFGEAVFTTAMTGYQETVTDPSFAEQLVCFTAPMVGNYGVADDRAESAGAHARAVLMREARGPEWTGWLADRGIVGISGIDTRSLVLRLRDGGSLRAAAVASPLAEDEAVEAVRATPQMTGAALVAQVSTRTPYVFAHVGTPRIAVVDYGCKRSILRRLAGAGAHVTVYPSTVTAPELAGYDGVLLSNGPGDPEPLHGEVREVGRLLGCVPILGICLGHQLLGLATGHRTFKLPFGHRGANHPVLDRRTHRVLVTSQNHGFAVAPSDADEATHVSLYDGTVEGFDFPELRARSVQFHPEAGPGPHDAWPLLEAWVEEVRDAC